MSNGQAHVGVTYEYIQTHTVIYGLYTIHWLHTNTEEQHTMANKNVMYHSISFLPVYGSCLAHMLFPGLIEPFSDLHYGGVYY